jgi:hypothetical protein
MIDKIEFLETQMQVHHTVLSDGIACIHLCIDIAKTGNKDLIEVIENGRR